MTLTKLETLKQQLQNLESVLEQLESNKPKLNQFIDTTLSVGQTLDNYQSTLNTWHENIQDIREAIVTLKQLIHLETVLNQYGMGDMV